MSDILTIAEVAAMLQTDTITVCRMVQEGNLQAIILPNKRETEAYQFQRETIERLVNPASGTEK